MIYVDISGGIGNQLFQYAFARDVSLKLNEKLVLDDTWYQQSTDRFFRLDYFNINARVGLKKYEKLYHAFHNNTFVPRQLRKILPQLIYNKSYYISQKKFCFYPVEIKGFNRRIGLGGLWQSEKYFEKSTSIIRNDLQFNDDMFPEIVLDKGVLIQNENSIMLHVRRGDYLSVPIYENLEKKYFIDAIELVCSKINAPKFYIFSDDINWVQFNLLNYFEKQNINYCIIGFTKTDIEDFFLMSKCRHAIISNSTFSWWAAWLNENNQKLIIAPDRWFKREVTKYPDIDILPGRWIKIHV